MGFSFLLIPVALILSLVGLIWKESRRMSVVGLVLTGAMLLLIFVPILCR